MGNTDRNIDIEMLIVVLQHCSKEIYDAASCGDEIKPGSDIYTLFGEEKVFCCADCALEANGITEIIYNDGDEDYESWFPKKEGEQ